jgi:hypothetical protein
MSISLSEISFLSTNLFKTVCLKSSLVTVFYPREKAPKRVSISPPMIASLRAILIMRSYSHTLL